MYRDDFMEWQMAMMGSGSFFIIIVNAITD